MRKSRIHNELPLLREIKELFSYDPETGEFIRLNDLKNGIKKGQIAGSSDKKGYIKIRVNGFTYSAHRLAWLYMTGVDPHLKEIDHVNGIKSDNRFSNLRLATDFQNARNAKIRRDNTSGFKGVSWHKGCKKFTARIMIKKKHINLGVYDNAEDAYAAYCKASKMLHRKFSNTGK